MGNHDAETASGRGAGRQALPAAGRRLRRNVRRLHLGSHFQPAEGAAADEPGAGAWAAPARGPHRSIRRAVRQAALDRHRNPRRHDPAELPRRHHQRAGIHRAGAHARSAPHDQGARALGDDDELRARADRWRFRRPAPSRVLEPQLGRALAAGRRVPAHGRRHRRCGAVHGDAVRQRGAQPQPGRLLHLARSPAAALRGRADPRSAAAVGLVQPQHALPVDRHAHRAAGRRARRILPRHPQPDRAEGRAVGDAGATAARDRRAQSGRRARAADA